ncbi:MAG: hypothetical protein JXJ04_11185 [Spirochaetales bacterium]|nr:hypothetical protein [Spirochaetales bacterium]
MMWYNYIACFFSGAFLANTVPHFIHGISGNKFPTPFAKPPGKGLSPPFINVLWALLNLLIGALLLWCGKVSTENILSLIIFFAGISLMSIQLSFVFSKKHKE